MRRAIVGLALAATLAAPAHAERRAPGAGVAPAVHASAGDVIAAARPYLGRSNPTGLRLPWCAAFVSMILRLSGHPPLAGNLAASALRYGPRLGGPRVGALMVMRGHVGFVAGVHGDRVTLLSGNWGRRVALAELPARAAVAYIGVTP